MIIFEWEKKEKLTQQLSQIDPNNSEWAEIAKDSFDFSLCARQRFEDGDTEDKKVIFNAIGSKPILLDQKLQFQIRYLFFQYKKGVEGKSDKKESLVPKNKSLNQANLENYLKSSLWCERQFLF